MGVQLKSSATVFSYSHHSTVRVHLPRLDLPPLATRVTTAECSFCLCQMRTPYRYGRPALAFTLVSCIVLCIPTTPLNVGGGFLFGWSYLPVLVACGVGGASLAFLIGRFSVLFLLFCTRWCFLHVRICTNPSALTHDARNPHYFLMA